MGAVAIDEPTEAMLDFVMAGRYGDDEDIKAGLAAGVDVDAQDYSKATALLMASGNGHIEIVRALLDAGASTSLANDSGSTPLHWAALNGKKEVCEVLLKANADPNLKNEFGRKAFDEAFGRSFTEVCELIAKFTDFSQGHVGFESVGPEEPEDEKKEEEPETPSKESKGEEPSTAKASKADATETPVKEEASKEPEKKEEAPVAKKEEAPAAKKEGKGKENKKSKDEKKTEPPAEDPEKVRKDLLKKVIKEGGKRGVEIEGAADMGGLQFFCTAVEFPDGDTELLLESMKAMNAESDPTEEERKGGSGRIGKMIFSAGSEQLAICAYVPESKQGELSCEEWLKTVLALHGGEVQSASSETSVGVVKADSDKGVFPLKIRESMIIEANNFLRKKGLFPEDDSDDDEMVFGDDDFPSM